MSSITTKPPTTVTSISNVPTVRSRGRMNLTVAHYYQYGHNNSMCIAPMSASHSAEKDMMAGGSSCHTIDPSTFPRTVSTQQAQPQHWRNCNPDTNNKMKIPSAASTTSDHLQQHQHPHPSSHLGPETVELPATSKLSNSAEQHSCSSPPRSVTIEAPISSCGIKNNNPAESSTFATSSKTTCTVKTHEHEHLIHEQGVDTDKGDISNTSRSGSTPSPNSTSMPINRNNTTRILSSPQSVAITGTENAHKIASATVATIIDNNTNTNNDEITTDMAIATNGSIKNVTCNTHTNNVSLLEKLPPSVSSSDPKGFPRARTASISSPPVIKGALSEVRASAAASLAMGQKSKPQDQQPRPVTAPEPAPASAPTSSAPAPVSSKVSSANVNSCRISTRPTSIPKIQRLGFGVKQDLQYNMAYMPEKVKMEKVYDMNLVPKVKKNRAFLEKWRRLAAWEQQSLRHELGLKNNNQEQTHGPPLSLPTLVPCDTSVDADVSDQDQDQDQEHISSSASSSSSATHTSECSMVHHNHHHRHHHGNMNIPCHVCLHPSDLCPDEKNYTSASSAINNTNKININNNMMPFAPDCDSVIWVPRTRQDWEDSIDEMVAICAAAEWHRACDMQNINKSSGRCRGRKRQKQMQQQQLSHNPPISRIYIRDRIEIDDPLRGYQIRHKTGGWMQGFVMMTNFTTWTHYFKWDSLHAVNGIDHNKGIGVGKGGVNDDGTLSAELEGQVRSGDALAEGVVWPTIAEMSLVGALGCGEYLLQMALDDISRRGTYDYVVLEATEAARPFYEKFGFIRVGAVCKYGNEKDVISENGEVQVVGYRHWTYANESEKRLDGHGGPSCMMARRVRRRTSISQSFGILCEDCGNRIRPSVSFVDELSSYFVSEKPKIESLGRMNSTANSNSNNGTTAGRGRPRKRPMSASGSETEKVAKKSKLSSSQSQPKQKKATTLSGRRTRAPSRLEEEEELRPKKCKQSTSRTTIEHKTKCNRRTSVNSSAAPISTSMVNAVIEAPTSGGKDKKNISLRKQRIPTMYRSPKKLYYYNKIVTLKKGEENSGLFQIKSKYYFVINYDAPSLTLQLIPLFLRGSFKGKREGRAKWKADVLPRDKDQDEESYLKSMHVITSTCEKWDIVQSHAVTKCASVKQESWDIVG